MNCHDFKAWLVDKDLYDDRISGVAAEHMESCEGCKKLFMHDARLEEYISDGLQTVDPPARLVARIERDIRAVDRRKMGSTLQWRRLVPTFAVAALVIMVFFNPFGAGIKNIDDIGSFALAEHLNSNLSMSFKAGEVKNVAGWFSQQLGFPIAIPEFEKRGYTLLGGRKCSLGKKEAAYLFYEQQGKKVSLFIINPTDLSFDLAGERSYRVHDQGHDVNIWKEGRMIYALVE